MRPGEKIIPTIFKYGEMARVIDSNNHFFEDLVEVRDVSYDGYRYVVESSNGHRFELYYYQLAKHFKHKDARDLHIQQLHQMADIALDTGDRNWFMKITKQLHAFSLATGDKSRGVAEV